MEKIFLGKTDIKIVEFEYEKLRTITNYKPNTRTGNIIVDFFTLKERLNTRGVKGVSFIEFYENIEMYKDKDYIRRVIEYCNTHNRYINEPEKRAKFIYNLYYGSITIFRPIVAMQILDWFPTPKTVLDPCAGWGGRLIGCSLKGVTEYIGIDTNTNLREPYEKLAEFLKSRSSIKTTMHFTDATQFDYSTIKYDMVLTSPPYYKKEIYTDMPEYKDFNKELYIPLFSKTWENLDIGGLYILNIPLKVLKCAIEILGEPTDKRPFPKNSRQNGYLEYIYIWKKI